MAKKSQRRPVRQERDQSGCMWGLVSMFDFCHGRSTQTLLSDRRHGPRRAVAAVNAMNKSALLTNLDENHQGIIGGEESITVAVDDGKPSVKKLIEEEMFCDEDLKKQMDSAEPKQSNSEYGGNKRKNCKRTNRSRSKSCEIYIEDLDDSEKLEPEKPCLQNLEKQSTDILDVDDMVEEFCRQIHHISCVKHDEHDEHDEVHSQLNQKNPDLEEKLREAIKLFISQRLINAKHVSGDGEIHPSEELKDALRILCSNEELSLKLLHGQKSAMVKYLENLWRAHVEKDDVSKPLVRSNLSEHVIDDFKQSNEIIPGKRLNFFRRKAKSLEKNPSKEIMASQALDKIVILKPEPIGVEKTGTEKTLGSSPESQSIIRNKGTNGVGSCFFLTEIKRRLKQAIGKEQQEIAPYGASKRFANKYRARGDSDKKYRENNGRNSLGKDHFFNEKIARPPSAVRKEEKTDMLKECEIDLEQETAAYPKNRMANIYVEAKKHLSDMLTSGTGVQNFSSGQVPKSLGRILSFPEYNFSPTGSPGREWGQGLVTAHMRFSSNNEFQKHESNGGHRGRMTLNSETDLCVSNDPAYSQAVTSANPKTCQYLQ
ncbi:uncharacterized protein LOC110617981 [Manihot esculenta]|uniref:Uncharacterized protein n=1 Tax=Manihot esculenta TaxID=3983 RepID=A0ACB7HMJ5_MANES|nr:uncharacterized protein LOC110617981 [Manihot esculenta]KAG8653144.1 hypothetical protein MANES_06G173132v8 [Manihot esculenta]